MRRRLPDPRRLLLLALAGGALAIPALVPAATTTTAPQGDLGSFQITTYWFVPEDRFTGRTMAAPGVTVRYREDFLYSAAGVAMEGTGTGLDGAEVHYAGTDGGYWVNSAGERTVPAGHGWTHGAPYWRDGGWRNAAGAPTFKDASGTWSNGQGTSRLPYHDRFGPGAGVPVTPWHSIATDRGVIPRGTRVYVPALATSPAGGCFVAEDTGSAIIGNHIDVLVPPDNTYPVPSAGNVIALGPGDPCPRVADPVDLGTVHLRYRRAAAAATATGKPLAVPGLAAHVAPEDLLFGADGAIREGVATLDDGVRVLPLGGGWWVNRAGQRTNERADGTWTRGAPLWRDGGWRTARGRPTWRLANGRWANGRGSRHRPYRDRFRVAADGERAAWSTAGVARSLAGAGIGALLKIAELPSVGCLTVDRRVTGLPLVIEILVGPDDPIDALPETSDVLALPPGADRAPCAN
jgi:hypothetical protein